MTGGLVLFVLDRWLKSVVPSQLTQAFVVQPTAVLLILLALLVIWVGAQRRTITLGAAGLISFGTLSNLIDGLLYKGVVDYLPFFGYRTNLADLMIIAGCVWCIASLVRHKKTAETA